MSTVRRRDGSPLAHVQRTPQGGIRVPSFLTRVGVFVYELSDGTERRELRPPEEVFSSDSLATLRGCTVTDLHPAEAVRTDNWKALAIGHVADEISTDRDKVSAELLVQDAGAIAKIDAGERKEISCGYTAELDPTGGVWNGLTYDAIQRNIRYNHVAIGPDNWGRAGRDVAMQLDSAGAQVRSDGWTFYEDEEKTMKITIKGKEYIADSAEAKQALAALEKDAARADAAEVSAKKAAREVLATNIRGLCRKHKLKIDEKDISGESGGSDIELMRALLAKIDPLFDADNPSEEYVRGCIGAAIKNMNTATVEPEEDPMTAAPDAASLPPGGTPGLPPPAHDSVTARGRKPIVVLAAKDGQRVDSSGNPPIEEIVDDAEKARRSMVTDQRDRWKRKPGT